MSSDKDELARTWLDAMGVATAETIAQQPQHTILPPVESDAEEEKARTLALLERLHGGAARVELGATIGQGGMGVVHTAEQLALGRTVAVKTLRPESRNQDAATALLREAWITGSLEHPNVVPVHDISLDDEGNPMIVLKRIEGVPWSELIHDGAAVRERFGAEDLLAWNLEIFGHVANAVRFAHSRAILHRDLKPDNVMIGSFGEVYVLDWGIAVSLTEDAGGRLPLARDATSMAGTPFYMAPEMLGKRAQELSERTDVYLLGSLLYEIMAGRPPHVGDSAFAILRSVALSDPDIPADAPAELARICRRAMSSEIAYRYESVEEMRLEVTLFLQHRGSARLTENAERDLDDLLELLEEGPPSDEHELAIWRQSLYRLFGACRFGFREALASWAGNRPAEEGLRRAITHMAEHELESGNARAAEAMLAELSDIPEALTRRLQKALREADERDERMAELERMRADLDPAVDASRRNAVGLLLAGSLVIGPLIVEWAGLVPAVTNPVLFGITLGFFGMMVAIFLGARNNMTWTAVNRRILGSTVLILGAQVAAEIGFWVMGAPVIYPLVFLLLIWGFNFSLLALTVELAFVPMASCFFLAFFVAAWRPELIAYCIAAGNLSVVVTAVIMTHRYDQGQTGAEPEGQE